MIFATAHPNSPFANWIIGLGFAAAIVLIVVTVLQAKRRTKDLAALAQQMGFTFLEKGGNGPVLSPGYKTSLLQRTRGRYHNTIAGQMDGFQVSVFDYTYGNGKNSVTQTLTCFSQNAELPAFELRPENIFDKIGDAIVNRDIDFDSHPEFSRRYHLRTPEEARIRMLFNPGLLTYLEQIPPDKKWHVEASGPSLIIYRHRWPAPAVEVPALLNEASAIAKMIFQNAGIKVTSM
jgi:hypothetical protein